MGFYNGGKVLSRYVPTGNPNKNRTIISGKQLYFSAKVRNVFESIVKTVFGLLYVFRIQINYIFTG